jgi:hypothetical protein
MSNKKVEITIPDFLNVGNYKKLLNIEHMTDINKLVYTVSVLADIDEKEIRTWSPNDIGIVANDLTETMAPKDMFYPIIEHDGVMYGYSNIDRMSLGEFMDLERLCKDPHDNLEEIFAVLYRPITKNRINKFGFKQLHNVRIFTEKLDNPFKWYDIEKYDNTIRLERAEIFKDLPIALLMGAMSFFLTVVNQYLTDTGVSSDNPVMSEMKKTLTKQNESLFQSIGGGLRQYILSPNQVFSTLQAKPVLLS